VACNYLVRAPLPAFRRSANSPIPTDAQHRKADFMKVYTVGYQDPLPRITKGKVVLIGDAAHPMMPSTPLHVNLRAIDN
jgi:2-polyprenyl-6-methoxyphenol hydroxylase-like FAD-dependent oxidoreductase